MGKFKSYELLDNLKGQILSWKDTLLCWVDETTLPVHFLIGNACSEQVGLKRKLFSWIWLPTLVPLHQHPSSQSHKCCLLLQVKAQVLFSEQSITCRKPVTELCKWRSSCKSIGGRGCLVAQVFFQWGIFFYWHRSTGLYTKDVISNTSGGMCYLE